MSSTLGETMKMPEGVSLTGAKSSRTLQPSDTAYEASLLFAKVATLEDDEDELSDEEEVLLLLEEVDEELELRVESSSVNSTSSEKINKKKIIN